MDDAVEGNICFVRNSSNVYCLACALWLKCKQVVHHLNNDEHRTNVNAIKRAEEARKKRYEFNEMD